MNQPTAASPSRWRARVVRVGAGIAVIAVVVGGGVAAYAAHSDAPDEYRTARVTRGDVDQILALSGTVDPSGRSDLAFGASGTVARLAVGVGDKVTRGQLLAALDTTTLKTAVTQANAQLAAARAQLAQDEDAQASTVTSTSTTSTGATTTTPTATTPTATTPTATTPAATTPAATAGKVLAQLAAGQHAVEVAQKAVDTAIAASQEALTQEQSACAAHTASSASADPSSAPSAAAEASDTDACRAAIEAVQAAQQAVAAAEYSGSGNLKDALAALSTTLTDAAKSAGTSSAPAPSAAGQQKGTTKTGAKSGTKTGATSTQASQASTQQTQQTVSGAQSGAASTSGFSGAQSVTAATLAKDQASIDAARASLIKATQALSGATIKAPHGGTVAQVSVTKGGSASTGSAAVVVIAPGTTTVELSVSSTQVTQLAVGQKAHVTVAGADDVHPGTVTRISRIPTTSSSGTTTYPVTVTLAEQGLDVLAGSTAAVDITLGSASDVLTVPTSAVSNGAVQVYADGEVSRVRVTTGLVGRARTVITDGLTAGQQVVLADLSADLPTSDGQTGTTRGFGSFPSGGLPSGGFGGGSSGRAG